MNKEYKIKLDLNKKLYNKKMAFNQFDKNVNDFYIEVTKNNEVVKDLDKSIITLVAIKPNNAVDAQFIEVKEGQIYADLKPSMCDLVGNYQAKAMIVLEGEIVTTDTINYSVSEDKIISRLNDDVVSDERFPLFTDALARLSTIEISEEQRVINEAERILSEENRKIEESKRVEAELVRQHEEADRTKYDATRESNENIRKINEEARISSENVRLENEANRIEQETNRVKAEQLRKDNYNFMTEDEERRRLEANAHKEAEVLRVQAETNRVNEEAKRRTTEQARVLAENTRVSNENTRKANEETRQNNETHRVEAETQRQSRYNSFIADAEANANNFENYTNTAKVKEEERKSNELNRKSQEDRRVSNEVERISNENTRKANEKAREKNETSRQNIFENKVSEVDEKIVELDTTKDNFISSINTKVDNKISEIDNAKDNFVASINTKVDTKISEIEVAKSDMTNTVSNKINEVETRFNALTSSQQQDAEVIDARDGETSLKARLDRDIEKAKQVYECVEGSNISTDSSVGYLKDIEILGNTIQSASNLADIKSVGDKVEGQELYEIPVLSRGKNLFNIDNISSNIISKSNDTYEIHTQTPIDLYNKGIFKAVKNVQYTVSYKAKLGTATNFRANFVYTDGSVQQFSYCNSTTEFIQITKTSDKNKQLDYVRFNWTNAGTIYIKDIQIEEGTVATPYEPYVEDKITILSPVQLEKVGDVRDRIIEKGGVWGVEKNVDTAILNGNEVWSLSVQTPYNRFLTKHIYIKAVDGIGVLSSKYKSSSFIDLWNNLDKESIASHNVDDGFLSIRANYSNVEEFKNSLKSNNILIKYIATQPTFIPLPHDQQVKLRTFANKTNISFLTEIEGTIKAQVPKSLGATVNTHTEQISNLNKELDRVKKLEESTVSTITTESDFTTVEATSGGYFEDVKLEGKTLINLFNFKAVGIVNEVNIYGYAQNYELTKGKEVTLVNNTDKVVIYDISKDSIWVRSYILNANTCIKATLEESEYIRCCYGAGARGWDANSESDKEKIKKTCIVLEGDHTQNLPNYFEGLKSVGQSGTTSEDGADEIVVSSVNPYGNLFDGELEVGSLNASGDTDWTSYVKTGLIRVKPSSEVICKIGKYKGENATSTDIRMAEYDMNKNFIKFSGGTYKATVSDKTHYVKFAKKLETSDDSRVDINAVSDVVVVYGNKLHDIPHQSDKKRLLYYNEETQTWEKPILRQWDSIEKHANGKYYYHQRSGEVVLNGSEEWASWLLLENTIGFLLTNTSFKNTTDKYAITAISDKLTSRSINDFKSDVEGIGLWDDRNRLVTRVNNSKLSTQDVQGFKQWLQTNNVTVVYQLAEEKVYECTNIDLITYVNETNYVIESGVLSPKTTLKVHSNISNVVSLLQKKVSLLESNMTKYMITQNRLMLASRYNADTVSFKVDVASFSDAFEYDNDLYELILNNVLVGKDNYNREYIENLIRFYWMDFVISDEMYSTLFEIIEEQHNPKIEEETPLI
jgi:hypothetical protein